MEVATLTVPDADVGKQCVTDANILKFKNDLVRVYGFEKDWESFLKLKENFDDFTLFFESGTDNPIVTIKRFKKGKTITITPADYTHVNKKLTEVKNLYQKQKNSAKQLEARKTVADLILKGLTANNLRFDVLKTGVQITVFDTEKKHHITCIVGTNGVITEPLIRMAYSYGKKITILELEAVTKKASSQMQVALKTAQQVKDMLPADWFSENKKTTNG